MSLPSGTRLGVFDIATQIGEGGMGQVYRAFDTKLKRQVAIKVLPASLAGDQDRLARFQREAEVLASLNHPNIAGIYGLEEGGPVTALVMELVEGEDLSQRLARGAIPLDEAWLMARQIAEALEAAHGQGIIHRDLKPANIKVRPDGTVKVLDFGLAKAVDPPAPSADVTQSPTITSPAMTGAGVILGTAAYMAPEQAKGKAVDKRADIWAFGSVLYEMLTARKAFAGDDITDTIVAVVSKEPDWSRLPPATPWGVRRVLTRCLEKDPRRRYHEVADLRLDLEDAMAAPAAAAAPVPRPGGRLGATAAAIAVTALAAAGLVWAVGAAAPVAPAASGGISRFMIEPAEPMPESEGFLIFSRDGRRVAYAAGPSGRQRLFVREVDQFSSTAVADTEGVVSATFSPDGQSIAFVAQRKLRSVALAGGAPLTLRERVDGAGLSWTTDQTILFSPGTATGVWRVPATGGNAAEVTKPGAKDNEQRFPELLPNGKGILYNARGGVTDDVVYVESLETHERRAIARGTAPHYLPTGHLAFVQAGTLFAVAFDAERLEATGEPVTLLEGIRQVRTGLPLIGYSDVGSIVYVPADSSPGANALVWVDRDGAETPAVASGRLYAQPRLSPDGRRVVTSLRGNTEDLWLIDLARGTSSRLTAESNTSFPAWTPDGRRLTLASARDGAYGIYWRPVDGSAVDEVLLKGDGPHYPFSWSPDGQVLALVSVNPTTLQDILTLRLGGNGKARPFVATQFREGGPTFSPDGKWIAYVSDESGRFEIYVRPFPGPGEKWAISVEGGNEPVWPRNGRQIFYRAGDTMMAVDVETTPVFSAGKPRKLFDKDYERSIALWANYDAAPDGERLLMVRRETAATPATHINVVLNWLDELKQRLDLR